MRMERHAAETSSMLGEDSAGDALQSSIAVSSVAATEIYARLRAFARRYRLAALPILEKLEGQVYSRAEIPEKATLIMKLVFHW